MIIVADDLEGPEVAALLAEHVAHMRAISPLESNHALDLDALRRPEVRFWTVWEDGTLVGCGALREIDPTHGEIKSMRTAAGSEGRGIGGRLVEHLLAEARRRGYRRVSLETGATDDFAPARRLYARYGFVGCPPFADYPEDPFSVHMTLVL